MKYGIINFFVDDAISVQVGHHLTNLMPSTLNIVQETPPDVIFVTAISPRTVIYDVAVPLSLHSKNLENALHELLTQYLPVTDAEVRWWYRKIADGQYKLCAIHHEEFEKIQKRIRDAKIHCDNFIPAQFIDNLAQCIDCRAVTAQIPNELRPIRYKKSKALYGCLVMAALGLAGYVTARQIQDYRLQAAVFEQHGKQLRQELKLQQDIFKKLSTEQALWEKIQETKPGFRSLGPVLAELTQRLPGHMWIADYMQKNEQVDLTVNSSKDDASLYQRLNEAVHFQLINLRKARLGTERVVFYLKLRSLTP